MTDPQKKQWLLKSFLSQPFRFVKKMVADFYTTLQEIEISDDPTAKRTLTLKAEDQIIKINKFQKFIIFSGYLLASTPEVIFYYQNHDQLTQSYLFLLRILIYLVLLIFLGKGNHLISTLRVALSNSTDVIHLPQIIKDFPSSFNEANCIKEITKSQINRLARLFGQPGAKEIVTLELRLRLFRYCDSVDAAQKAGDKDKYWSAKLRNAVVSLEAADFAAEGLSWPTPDGVLN